MTYRALFTADIHVGNQMPWSVKDPKTLISDRALDIVAVLDQMMEYALEQGIKDIWIIGDLIDKRRPDAVTLKLVSAALVHLQEVGLNVRMVPGNHESDNAAGLHFTLDAYANMGFWVAGSSDTEDQISVIEPVDGFKVIAMPYLPLQRANRIVDAGRDYTLALIHQTIKGGMVGGWTAPDGMDPELLESIALHTLSGHFHTPQDVTNRVHYLGAPLQHQFSDAGDKRGYWDVTWTGKFCHRKMINVVGAPKFYEHIWSSAGDLPALDAGLVASSYNTLKVQGTDAWVKQHMPDAEEWCRQQRERGARLARAVPSISVVQKRARIKLDGDGGSQPTWPKLISNYLDAADCTGLNRQVLEGLGMEIVADVDK